MRPTVTDRIDPIRGDIAELRHEMKLGFAQAAREQLRFLFLAWAVLLAAIIGLYAR